MEPATPLPSLTSLDVKRDIDKNRPRWLWHDTKPPFVFFSGVGCALLVSGILKGIEYVCKQNISSNNKGTFVVSSFALGLFGSIAYIRHINNKIKTADPLLKDIHAIITKTQYAKLQNILGSLLSPNLNKEYRIPEKLVPEGFYYSTDATQRIINNELDKLEKIKASQQQASKL